MNSIRCLIVVGLLGWTSLAAAQDQSGMTVEVMPGVQSFSHGMAVEVVPGISSYSVGTLQGYAGALAEQAQLDYERRQTNERLDRLERRQAVDRRCASLSEREKSTAVTCW